MSKAGKSYLGKGRIELLEKIGEHGSITKAALAMKMSYKAAWDAVDAMNVLSDEPLVIRTSGGKDGGGTQLTESGRKTIHLFRHLEDEHRTFLNALTKKFALLESDNR